MDANSNNHSTEAAGNESLSQETHSAGVISIEQLQRLIHLLDSSSVSELQLKYLGDGTRLVLRKAKAPASQETRDGVEVSAQFVEAPMPQNEPAPAPSETEHKVVAHLVGTFHTWARPRGGALVAVGDRVKTGQLVGTIESLNVFNEVESPVNGHVVNIVVQDGQPVEYGQLLMTIAGS